MRKFLLTLCRWWSLLFFAGLAFLGMQREDPEGLPSAIAGQKAPKVQLDPLEGACALRTGGFEPPAG